MSKIEPEAWKRGNQRGAGWGILVEEGKGLVEEHI